VTEPRILPTASLTGPPPSTARCAVPIATVLQMTGSVHPARRALLVVTLAVLIVPGVLSPLTLSGFPAAASQPPGSSDVDPAALVHPLDGTATGPVSPGTVGEFPGADVPFGMVQWSPDTSPNAAQAGGGYAYDDSSLDGFSLTHLSGTGCPSYQDVPILPVEGAVTSPATTVARFSHQEEHAAPGRYQVVLGGQGQAPIPVSLAVTTRSGISSFTFPAGTESNVLFKVADGSNPVTASSVHVVGHDEVEGQVSSGQFCGTGTSYTLHFVALFDRPFSSAGTWAAAGVAPATAACTGTTCGSYVTFDTTTQRQVLMKVGVSFVSTDDALQNLRAEDPGWSVQRVAAQAQDSWNALLGRIAVRGGTAAEQHTFYTALYHSLLFPNVVSDVSGRFEGSDGKVQTASGREMYANFSEWDIYRSEIQLEALVDPHAVGDMVQSLVDDAQQTGWLPKWAIVGGDESQMNGDSADPIIADALAMGVHNFDVPLALKYMVKGASQTETGHGLEIERQYLSQYLSQHYVNAGSLDLTSIDYSIGGSATLEYAIDDFAIAQVAAAQHDNSLASTMRTRAANWEYLFNPTTGYVQARGTDGSFPIGAAFETSQLEPGGQTGFEEGNAVQYTWSVPQDLAALASLMGGDSAAAAKLQAFMGSLNATRDVPQDWSGNEPDEWVPWEFDFFGAPDETQHFVRAIADSEYADSPVDEPGNDDLGALSSWYVWAAIGMFPVTPGAANLSLASPLFPSVNVTLPNGRHLVEQAAGAAASRPYVHTLSVSGIARPVTAGSTCGGTTSAHTSAGNWDLPWLPASTLSTGGTLNYALSGTADPSWGSAPGAAPPSFGSGQLPAVGFSDPSGSTTLTVGQPASVALGLAPAGSEGATVHWQVAPSPGVTVTPSSGTFTITRPPTGTGTPGGCSETPPSTQTLRVTASVAGSAVLRVDLSTTGDVTLPPVVVDLQVQS
jgi:predicted alpha-1,2-mannosidase